MYYVLYIAINISTITVDKYSGLFTTRGTKRSCGTLLPLGCHTAPKDDIGWGDTYSVPMTLK